jgi:threonine dehydratase
MSIAESQAAFARVISKEQERKSPSTELSSKISGDLGMNAITMELPTLTDLEAAATLIAPLVPPTPQYAWPLLAHQAGCEVWVKHENHTPIGAFKVRGGLVYLDDLMRRQPDCPGVIAATRGNHGQSIAFAARRHGGRAVIVVPHGNSIEKNAAMEALGAELIVSGHDFQAALEYAAQRAAAEQLHMLPSFHPLLVQGVGTYAIELFRNVADLDAVYVPIGLGSGICGTIAARNALNLRTKIIGVVAERAPCYALSFAESRLVTTGSADTFADGMACRTPVAEAVEIINRWAERVVMVSEEQIAAAMRLYFTAAHQVAEGAGAAPLAALLAEPRQTRTRRVALVLSGGNVDAEVYRRVLDGVN